MSSRSRGSSRTALILCGALSADATAWIQESGAQVDIHPLPPLLHNRPERIAPEVERLIGELRGDYDEIVIGYADCGTYGALDEVCDRLDIGRLPGRHCYDIYAGEQEMTAIWEADPGTYVLTDFLVLSFDRVVWRELGLDRHPELRHDYFRHYTRVVWLAGRRTPDMERAAERAAERLGLPLEIIDAPGRLGAGLDGLLA
ncbi:MAG: DUF1638 domain-containing protein [Actinomycetota bacterium]